MEPKKQEIRKSSNIYIGSLVKVKYRHQSKLLKKLTNPTYIAKSTTTFTHGKSCVNKTLIHYANSFHSHDSEPKTWISKPKTATEIANVYAADLIKLLSYEKNFEIAEPLISGLSSFTTLNEIRGRSKLLLNIPDTFMFGYGLEEPIFMYTDLDGSLKSCRISKPNQIETIGKIFQYWKRKHRENIESPLCILRAHDGQYNRPLLDPKELKTESKKVMKGEMVLQRYILPKGRKAYKIRVIWKPTGVSIYTITNNMQFDGNNEWKPKESVFYSSGPTDQAALRVRKLCTPLTNHPRLKKQTPKEEENETFCADNDSESERELPKQEDSKSRLKTQEEFYKNSPAIEELKCKELKLKQGLRYIGDFDFKLSQQRNRSLALLHREPFHNTVIRPPTRGTGSGLAKELRSLGVLERLYTKLQKIKHIDYSKVRAPSPDAPPPSGSTISKLRGYFCTTTKDITKTTIYSVKSTKGYEKAVKQIMTLRQAIDRKLLAPDGQKLNELACDFTEDENGVFYFLKIKAFTIKALPSSTTLSKPLPKAPTQECQGKYCGYLLELILSLNPASQNHRRYFILRKQLYQLDTPSIEELLSNKILDKVPVCKTCYFVYKLQETNKKLEIGSVDFDNMIQSFFEDENEAVRVLEKKYVPLASGSRPTSKYKNRIAIN